MPLPEVDLAFLIERGIAHETTEADGMTCVVFPGFQLPDGLDRPNADLLVRLPALYPDVAPDMWWFDPGVHMANGGAIQATESVEQHLGRSWQRWSRHFEAGQWQSGIDGLESYLALITRELAKNAMVPSS